MKEARRLDLRLVLLVAFVAAAIWAATALAGGSQSPAGDAGPSQSKLVQDEGGEGTQPPSGDDCPDRGGGGNDGSGGGAPDV